ncbi:hypothetical protein BDR07DRAFT_171010 [Suillus spraguei]|nr:hypothetical protein BDR07DRAFT_171010 [Suillus spraguei]
MSNTPEQIPDIPRSNNTNESPLESIEKEKSFAKNISDTLDQILDVLKGSTIAEERGIDANSKFWATYKKDSTEYDDDFLGRANDDMGIILTFAGLFSAVNSTFIVGMQPNPGDTTNVLLLHLIQISVNGQIPYLTPALFPHPRDFLPRPYECKHLLMLALHLASWPRSGLSWANNGSTLTGQLKDEGLLKSAG